MLQYLASKIWRHQITAIKIGDLQSFVREIMIAIDYFFTFPSTKAHINLNHDCASVHPAALASIHDMSSKPTVGRQATISLTDRGPTRHCPRLSVGNSEHRNLTCKFLAELYIVFAISQFSELVLPQSQWIWESSRILPVYVQHTQWVFIRILPCSGYMTLILFYNWYLWLNYNLRSRVTEPPHYPPVILHENVRIFLSGKMVKTKKQKKSQVAPYIVLSIHAATI